MSEIDEETVTLLAIRAAMYEFYTADSCIAATKCALEYLSQCGYDGDGVQAEAMIYNAKFIERAANGIQGPEILKDPEAYSVGIGYSGPGKEHGLHVVYLGYRGEDVLFADLSLDQASRPQHQMLTGPLVIRTDRQYARKFLHGGTLSYRAPDGVVVFYRRYRGKEAFRASPNWDGRDAMLRRTIIANAKRLAMEVRDD